MGKKQSLLSLESLPEIDPISGLADIQGTSTTPLVDVDFGALVRSVPELEVPIGPEEVSRYDEGLTYEEAITPGGIMAHRQEEQPALLSLGAALNQAVVGEVVGGTLEGVGYMLDLEQHMNQLAGEEQEWGNWLSDIGKDLRTWTQETTPIYRDPNAPDWNPSSWNWWMTNVPSILSTLSLMLPTGAAVRGATMLARGLNISNKLGKATKFAAKGIGGAIVSRQMESMMEAAGTFDENYENFKDEVDPETGQLFTEEKARQLASIAASHTYKWNWAALAQDIPQYLAIGSAFGKASARNTKAIMQKLGYSSRDIAIAQGKRTLSTLATAASEGLEENYQSFVSSEGRYLAEVEAGLIDETTLSYRLGEHLKSGETWTSTAFGALGGSVFQAVGGRINKAIDKSNGQLSPEEKRIKNISGWGAEASKWNTEIQQAKESGDVTAEKAAREQMLLSMGMNAAKNGNLQNMIDFVDAMADPTSEDLERFGISQEDAQAMRENLPKAAEKLKKLEKIYDRNVGRYDAPFDNLITREEMNIENLKESQEELEGQVAELMGEQLDYDKLSDSGRQIFESELELEAVRKDIQALRQQAKEAPTKKDKEVINKRIDEQVGFRDSIKERISKLKEERTPEDKANDKSIDTSSPALDDLYSARTKLESVRSAIKGSQENVKLYKDPKRKEEAQRLLKENTKKAIQEAVKTAQTKEELDKLEAGVPEEEKETVDKAIKEEAEKQEDTTQLGENLTDDDLPTISEEEKAAPNNVKAEQRVLSLYEGRPGMFKEHGKAIANAINNSNLSEDLKQQAISMLGKVEDFAKLMGIAYHPANANNADFKELIRVVDNFIKNTANAKKARATQGDVNTDNQQEVTIYTKGTGQTSDDGSVDIEGEAQIRDAFSTRVWQYAMKKVQGALRDTFKWVLDYKEENTQANPLASEFERIDWNYVNNPNTLAVGTELEFIVDTDRTIGTNKSDYHKGLSGDEFIKKAQILIGTRNETGELVIVGAVEAYNPEMQTNGNKLLDLRRKVLQGALDSGQTQGDYNSGLVTNVTEKYKGRIHSSSTLNNPHQVVTDGSPLIFGVGVQVGDNVEIQTNGAIDYDTAGGKPKSGAVYVMVPASDGSIIPLRAFTNILAEVPEVQKEVNKIIDEINIDNWEDKKEELRGNVFVNFTYYKNGDFKVYHGPADKRTSTTMDAEAFKRFLENYVVQVKVSDINTGNYNQTISEQGRLKLDVVPGQYTVASRFDYSENIQEKSVSNANKVEGETSKTASSSLTSPTSTITEGSKETAEPNEASDDTSANKTTKSFKDLIAGYTGEAADLEEQKEADKVHEEEAGLEGLDSLDDFGDTDDGFDIDLGDPDDDFKLLRTDAGGSQRPWKQGEEIAWFKKNFPQIPVEVVKGLIEIDRNGGLSAYGMFRNATVMLSDLAVEGTTYHEAMHVVFNLFLNEKEQQAIFKEAHAKFHKTGIPTQKIEEYKVLYGVDSATAHKLILEEELAEAFRDFQLNGGRLTNIGRAIEHFFRRLWNYITNRTDSDLTMRELFLRADNGYYANKQFVRPVDKFKSSERYLIKGYNARTQHRRVTALTDVFSKMVDAYIKANPDKFAGQDRANVIETIGVDTIYKKAYASIAKKAKALKAAGKLSKEAELEYAKMLNNIRFKDVNGNDQFGVLMLLSSRQLADKEGIKVATSSAIVTAANDGLVGAEFEIDEDGPQLEGWQVKQTQVSGKASLSKEMRRALSYLPELDGNGNPKYDDLGFQLYVDGDEAYNFLKRELADIYDRSQMMTRLKELAQQRPYLNTMLENFKGGERLKTLFFTDFQKSHQNSSIIVQNDKGEMNLFSENRNAVGVLVLEEWANNLYNPVRNGLANGDGTINKEKAKKFGEAWNKLRNRTKNKTKLEHADLVDIAKAYTYVGLELDVNDLAKMNQVPVTNTSKTAKPAARILKVMKESDKIMARFAAGNNPFEGDTKESTALLRVAKSVASLRPELMESSYRNVENELVYAHSVGNALSKLIADIKGPNYEEFIKNYTNTGFYKTSPWLRRLMESAELREAFTYVTLGGIRYQGKSKGVKYSSMSQVDFTATNLGMFFNNNNSKVAYYHAGIFADAPNAAFIPFAKLTNKEVIEDLYQAVLQEHARIQLVKERLKSKKTSKITNFDNKKSTKYIMFPFMNKFSGAVTEELDVKKAIQDWLESELVNERKQLNDLGIFKKDDLRVDKRIVDGKGSVQGVAYKNADEFVRNYFYNTVLANTQIMTLTSGDPAFYKPDGRKDVDITRTVDYQKRHKQNWSPKQILDVAAKFISRDGTVVETGETYRTIYLQDAEKASPRAEAIYKAAVAAGGAEYGAMIGAQYGYSNHTKPDSDGKEVKYVKVKGKDLFFKTKTINEADAQAYITLPRYRKIMIGLGRWTQEYEDAYPRLLAGQANREDLNLVMQPLKPFYFGHRKVDGMIVPVQNKNSEFLLLPQLVNKSPELKKLYDYMMTNEIDSANFESAVKAGLSKAVTIDDLATVKANDIAHTLSNRDYGLQQETPAHHIDHDQLIGTQVSKLAVSDIDENALFKLFGNTMNKQEFLEFYQNLNEADINERLEKTLKLFKDNKELSKMIKQEMIDRNLGLDMELAVDLVDGEFRLPLSHYLISNKTEAILNAIFKSRVIKRKIKGGPMVQVSSFGFTNDLELKVNEETGALEYAECYLPWWSKQYLPLNEKGELDISKVPDDLKEMIGYRIPTEGKYSMLPLKVKGFLPQQSGGAIMLPMEITTVAGSDFDIDKLYVMMPEFKVNHGNDVNINDVIYKAHQKAVSLGKARSVFDKSFYNIEDILDKIENEIPLVPEELAIEGFYRRFVVNNPKYAPTTIEKVQYDINKSAQENSAAARNNAKLQVMWQSLTHPQTFKQFITPGGYEGLRENAEAIKKLEGVTDAGMNIMLPNIQRTLFERNIPAFGLRGVWVNHNNSHAIFQDNDISFKTGISFDGETRNDLSDRYDIEGNLISGVLNQYLAAVVDNTKDPVVGFMNVNTYTSDVAAAILRVGYTNRTVAGFLKQPVISEFLRLYTSKGSNKQAEMEAFAELEKQFRDKGVKLEKNVIANLSTNKMWNNIGKPLNFTLEQAQVLQAFKYYKQHQAKALADAVRATRADTATVGPGPTVAQNIYYLDLVDRVEQSEDILGVSGITSGNKFKLIKAAVNAIRETNKVIDKYYPWNNEYFTSVRYLIGKGQSEGFLTVDQINYLNYETYTHAATSFEYFSPDERGDIINNFPKEFDKLVTEDAEFASYEIIKHLELRRKNSKIAVDRIEYRNSGDTTGFKADQIKDSWLDLMSNPKYSKVAHKLAKYAFFATGMGIGPNGFNNLLSTTFFESLTDSNGVKFNTFLEGVRQEEAIPMEALTGMYDQFYRNNASNSQYVPRINKLQTNISTAIVNVGNQPAYFYVNPNDKNLSQDFILRRSKDPFTGEDRIEFSPYVAYRRGKDIFLFKGTIDPATNIIQYNRVEKLGYPNYFKEYDRRSAYISSVIPTNAVPKEVTNAPRAYYGTLLKLSPKPVDVKSIREKGHKISQTKIDEYIKNCKK